jgi:hypothetical protein
MEAEVHARAAEAKIIRRRAALPAQKKNSCPSSTAYWGTEKIARHRQKLDKTF